MGKNEDEQALSGLHVYSGEVGGGNGGLNCSQCRSIAKIASWRCVLVLLVGVAVFLSAAFWLLPFFGRLRGGSDPDPDPQFRGASVVASFRVQKPASLVNENIMKLQYDIFEVIGVPNSSVAVISLEPLAASNETNVVFGIWPYPRSTIISSTGLSIIREYFMAFVIHQSSLPLTTSLFGRTYFFQVLKFPGGITVIPQQSVFLLQKVQMLFNFTLNFPIYKVQDKFDELKSQMKSGLLLTSYENLYVTLTNLKGSTVTPPTVVQTSIVLAVGNRQPSIPRLRQLAQTISSSSGGNLGLNHTVFGKVKQIQLSSFLNHSLNGGGNGISTTPSPAPQPQVEHHHHHHHHHQHHHSHHFDTDLAPAPAPQHTSESPPSPRGCHTLSRKKPKGIFHIVPAAAPVDSPLSSPAHAPAPAQYEDPPAPSPVEDPPAPSPVEDPQAPIPRSSHMHVPHVVLARARPPSKSSTETKPLDKMSPVSPPPFSLEDLETWRGFLCMPSFRCKPAILCLLDQFSHPIFPGPLAMKGKNGNVVFASLCGKQVTPLDLQPCTRELKKIYMGCTAQRMQRP